MTEQQVAGMEGFGFEVGAVAGDEKPVADLVAQQLDGTEGREFAAEGSVGGAGGVGEDEPDAVVSRGLRVVAEHADDAVADVDGEAGEHAAHLGFQGRERFEDERMRGLRLCFRRADHQILGTITD